MTRRNDALLLSEPRLTLSWRLRNEGALAMYWVMEETMSVHRLTELTLESLELPRNYFRHFVRKRKSKLVFPIADVTIHPQVSLRSMRSAWPMKLPRRDGAIGAIVPGSLADGGP